MKRRCLIESKSTKKNHYNFATNDHNHLTITSNFQSGNIRLVRQVSPNIVPDYIIEYVLQAVSDIEYSASKKAWFFFKMKSSEVFRARVEIRNVIIYESSANKNLQCQPVYKVGCNGSWYPISNSYLSNDDDPRLIFDYKLPKSEEVFFCISIPFTYSDNQIYLTNLQNRISPQIYFKNEFLVSTLENRDIRLLTISEYGTNNPEIERKNKPVVLVTSRVHPGEVTSSFLLMGMLEMLIENTLQSYLLRRLFEWKIVPMLNPDGVAAGNYRLDLQGCNLNREYLYPDQVLHPASFKILELMHQVSASSRKIQFYFDLHSHSSMKDGFIYGNALDDLIHQSYSQLFCRILQENNMWFKYSLCQFGQKHMKHKDKGEEKTKQGCGRVMALKISKVIRSYTLETSMLPGYYYKNQKGMPKQQKNQNFEYLPEGYSSSLGLKEGVKKENTSQNPMITITKQLGRDVLISMLDMLQKNPYTRINNEYNRIVLRDLAQKLLQKEERFKIFDIHTYQKPKIAYKIVEEEIEATANDAWSRAGIANIFNTIRWPEEFKMISCLLLPRNKLRLKLQSLRCRSQSKDQDQIKQNLILKKIPRLMTQQEHREQSYMPIDNSDIQISKNQILNSKSDKDSDCQIKYALKSSEKVDASNCKIFYNLPVNLLSNAIIDYQSQKQSNQHSLLNKKVIHNITPSMCLRNSAKSLAKERTEKKKLSIKNCYQVSIQERKRALTQLRSPLDQYPSIFGTGQLSYLYSLAKFQKDKSISTNQEKSKSKINSKDVKSFHDKERASVKLPSMNNNNNKQEMFQAFLLRKSVK